ncbi:DUF185-domain-containing protein [Pleomassaria siparia CBS 279.74]|uniref:Protein arginine methyltransferase NDUFAF7 n=1 Tax=Pleomassaria siparia CBS 279.74 TaxID=1314801 RepID=A0A6G1K5G7_9PLEO|nr:DUF185-domain-containing protein [Pleomassaria siparia CBS 279.74]
MDSPLVTKLFRQLFTNRASQCLTRRAHPAFATGRHVHIHRRGLASRKEPGETTSESGWKPRTQAFPHERIEEFDRYPMVTASILKNRRERPKRVKMLLRDFISDSLYNPHYGYFSKQVVIFSPGDPFNFNKMKTEEVFHKQLRRRYIEFEEALDLQEPNDLRQLWHTPTELFSPYYGEAIGRYIVHDYYLNHYPHRDLNIYEMGAGNGTMMLNILDYLRRVHPEVYDQTKYTIIEISSSLASLQQEGLGQTIQSRGHTDKVKIVNRSIFDWNQTVWSPCYFVALEVFDNFAHDAIKYDLTTGEAYQSHVVVDQRGELYEYYTKEIDPIAREYLNRRDIIWGNFSQPPPHPLDKPGMDKSGMIQRLRSLLPVSDNLSGPEYIPTMMMEFFHVLDRFFPDSYLISSDFNKLNDAVPGINGPVVQTRYKKQMIPVTTPLVHQGYFDILFPTDFDVAAKMYSNITNKHAIHMTHEDFMNGRADVLETQTKNGENPMVTWYQNASFLLTWGSYSDLRP